MSQELFPLAVAPTSIKKVRKPRQPRKPRDPNAPKPPRKVSVPQQIIFNLVSDMRGCHDVGVWKNEMRICALLRKKYGDEFLIWVKPIEGYKFNSLVFYLSVLGKNYLSDQMVEYAKTKGVQTAETKEIPLSETKIGEDVITEFKPRTLKEFLNYGKEIRRLGATAATTSGQECGIQKPAVGTASGDKGNAL